MAFARAEAFAPASMGNVGIGFDVLGLAFESPGDVVVAARRPEPGVSIEAIYGDGGRLTLDPAKNSAGVAALATLKLIGTDEGVSLEIHKDLPLASGMGSSAASAVAAAVAVNAVFGSPLQKSELLPACLAGEAAVSGYHADNVAPALLGGITLICGTDADRIYSLPVPSNLVFALVTPNVAVPTVEARAVLPKEIPLKQMIHQTAEVARAVDALYRGDLRALAAAMESDIVVEPARKHLMPGLDACRAAAKGAGALGLVISGAGPTLAAICDSPETAKAVAAVLRGVYAEIGMGCVARVTGVSLDGAGVRALA
ncbi:MAG: homoserine kinase [Chloroflexi bacterium]|nr:homoserine kinase [Chloroflexota bacterium]